MVSPPLFLLSRGSRVLLAIRSSRRADAGGFVAGGEGDLEPRAGGVVPDAGRRHGRRRTHAHSLLLHVSRPPQPSLTAPPYTLRFGGSVCLVPDLFGSDL